MSFSLSPYLFTQPSRFSNHLLLLFLSFLHPLLLCLLTIGSFSQVVTKTPNRPEGPFARFPFPVVGALSMHDVRTLVHKHIKIRSEISDEVSALRRTLGLSSPSSPLPQTSTASTAAIATHHPAFVSPPLATSTDPSALFVIGVHYRGLDKIDAYPFKQAPPDLFRAVIQEVVKTYQPSSWKLFVATDTADFLDFMLMVFGPDKVIYQKDVPRIYIKDVTYQADGTPVPVHKEKSFPPYIKAKVSKHKCTPTLSGLKVLCIM